MTGLLPDVGNCGEPPSSLLIIGKPVTQSLSPLIQNAAIAAAGINAHYDRLEVDATELASVLHRCARDGIAGNITMPHKEAAHATIQRLTVLAHRIGSVNTFWVERGELYGHNTDVEGALATIRALVPDQLTNRRVAILGAGGSAAAVLFAVHIAGCTDIHMHSRTPSRGSAIAARVNVPVHLAESALDAVRGAALVINATPLGMRDDDAMPVDAAVLDDSCAVFDLVYRRGETAWVRVCRARGLPAEDGLRMLVEQGAAAFRAWYGRDPSLEAMWNAVR